MKGRSSRNQSSDHQNNDDWVDGSWTVDCICGVNFDDGEEMVDCDECGVWVHTRCSGYDKGDKMFTCDKCKGGPGNYSRGGGENGDNEETEVAQLLVELPNKTVRMESGGGGGGSGVLGDDGTGGTGSGRRPYRLWTDIPMEERVHVQGVPGGDPSLFSGLSRVFSPQLWKSMGYVPKKFNFQYKEFPCWDYDDNDNNGVEVGSIDDRDDKGAGVLFSLAKENALPSTSHGVEVVGMGVGVDGRASSRNASSKEMKKLDLEDSDFRQAQSAKRERSLLRPAKIQSNIKKKEDLGTAKDCKGREKILAVDKEAEMKMSGANSSAKVLAPCSDAKQVEFFEDQGIRTSRASSQSVKGLKSRDDATRELKKSLAVDRMDRNVKNISAVNEHTSNSLSLDKCRTSCGDMVSKGSVGNQPTTFGSSVGPDPSAVEEDMKTVDDMGSSEGYTNNSEKPPEKGLHNTVSEIKCIKVIRDVDSGRVAGSAGPCIRVKTDLDKKSGAELQTRSSNPAEAKRRVQTTNHMSENHKVNDAFASCSQSNPKSIKVGRKSEETLEYHKDTHRVEASNTLQEKKDVDGPDCPVAGEKVDLEVTNSFGNSSALPKQKSLPSVAKSSSSSSTNVISRSSTSDMSNPADSQNPSPITIEQVTSKSNASNKETSTNDLASCEEMNDVSRRVSNSSGKSSVKMKYTSKISQTYVSKRNISATKDSANHSSGKSGSSDSAGSFKNRKETYLENNKTSSSNSLQRGEKLNQSHTQPSANLNQTLTRPTAISNTPAALSDEELALLLHQELNSSPRVPRVPRVRHAGSLPHLASSTATSMLVKRTSSAGGKDHKSFSKKRNKDVEDDPRRSRDLDHEVKKAERLIPPFPEQRRQGTGVLAKRNDNGSSIVVHTRKSRPSSNPAHSGPSSPPEANDNDLSTVHDSSRRNLDDDSGTVTVPVYRTLPRLISEIMSKGKRMTYEELCNAVLPHWHSLRKHNGERYAYSSHSQAVLDCLRNRHEWAQLVDRGPKTSASRKRRMLDTEESDDDEYMKDITVKELDGRNFESPREDHPKGKRKARRRRRLALQGRGIRDVRKRQKTDMLSDDDDDDDDCSLPDSSEDSMFNEYDSQGSGGAQPVGSEASASSD